MASNMQSFPRMLKMLRENSNIKEKREALTYIRSNSKKLESTQVIKEEQYKELCKLIVDAFANGNNDIQNEAYETLNVVIQEFKDHTLNLFEAISQISRKHRLKILKLLEVVEENAISTFVHDPHAVNFFNNCMCAVQTNTMPWIAPTACVDNLQALIDAESSKPLSDDQRLEEETVNYCITFLRRLYKVAAVTSDIKVQRFNAILIDKVMILAYMGHKRQRGPALKLLQQALTANILPHVRTKLASAWTRYIEALQSTYCKRMLLLVSACELDWATQWNVSIQFLGVDLHRGAGLINNLLSVEEKAFKSTDTIIRRQAFLSWKLLVDNFALDPHELASARRIKLLCIPLNAKNSKTELIALTKLEVWWHVIIKLYKDISKFVNPVITQFLNFCFGPLGDTPLLSSKFDIVASPGKRFFKTKVVAVDALYQFLVSKQENHTAPVLEERLPYPISDAIFQECYKSIIHSVGEVLLVFSQLTDEEMKNRYQVGKILWKSLVNYIRESKLEDKSIMYKDITLVITELTNYAKNKPMIRNLILDTILFEIADLSIDFNFQDDTLSKLVFKLLQIPILNEAKKDHYNALKCLFWQCIKSQKENIYYSHAFNCLKEMYEKLHALLNIANKNESIIFELWLMLGDVLGKYMSDIQEINEGTTTEHNLKTVQSIVVFPFMYIHLQDQKQIQELAKAWKYLYKHFEMRTDLITTVKSNEILLSIASIMQHSITKNKESPYLTIYCLDILLSTINYKLLLVNTEIPSVIHLIVDLILYFLSEKEAKECELALKAMSATIITIYGHNPEKITPYLQVCKSVIELILQSELEMLNKEVANTWESIISIFKELGKVINYDLFSSYKKLIIQALNHSNVDIQIQTASLFESKNVFSDSIKLLLEEIEKETGKDKILNIAEITKKKHAQIEKLPNQIKIVGSFLKGSNSPNLIVKESDKNMDKNTGKKASIDSDSQDYVFIKTDLKFDVNRLTEHQKESLKRRREDIPALYNDLSQSSSQDTQNLQEWFDKKNKIFEETEKENNKKDNVSIKNILDDDANKENKIEIQELETINKSFIETDTKSMDSVERNIALESVQKTKVNVDNNEILLIEKQTAIVENAYDNAEAKTSADFVSKNLDTNIQEELLKNKDDQRLSPSVLDNSKRRNRFNITVKSTLPKSEEIVSNQPEQYSNTTEVLQRTLRTKVIQSKSETTNKQKASENMENKSTKEDRRGIKRKLDNENEGTNLRQRRKLMDTTSDVDSCKSSENDKISINEANLSQRTRNEISRLRINMVFDTPLSTSRRSKSHEDTKDNKEFIAKKYSIENKSAKLKAGDIKVSDAKKVQKLNDKELKVKAKPGRKRSDEKYLIKKDKKNESEEQKKVEEKKKEEIKHVEVISKNTTDNKCDSFDEKSIESNDDVKLNESKSHTQDDMEDVIEDSQGLSKLGRNRLLKVKLEINKIEDIKKISQHNKNELKEEIDKEKDEKKQKETVQTEIISKNIDNKCDLLDTKKSIKINVEIVNNNNNNNNNNQNNNDNHNNNNNHNHNNINDDIKSDSNIQTINQDHESIEGKSQIQDDMEDIIENSQESSELEKKYDEKQYFIKINRIEDISSSMKCHEITIEDEEVSEIILNNCDNDNIEVPKDNIKEFEETNEINMIEPKISSSVIENNLCDNEKDTIVDVQKVNDGLVSKSLLEFSSPKSTMKRQAKFKSYSSYSTQGRAAHMIGLVTKQARMETESCVINLDDELVGKKIKSKDTDNDILLGKKEQGSVLKEADKITALCSSRQEKIFNNMRSTDYCPSPPIKLFSNLKNDGEKIFSKTDKSIDNALIQNDIQTDKIGEETLETDELPILEWSNANPPSLNASPSASILKRQRQYFPESDSDITPNKRKRVSFADPPVSKEMGYEITSTDSPHKINKFTSRGLLARKDSSLRLKQIKQKLTSVDSDKLEKSEEIDMTNVSEVDLQCERENELLTKIAEELEYSENVTIDSDVQTSCDSAENESINTVPIIVNKDNNIKINNLNVEFEITQHIESISTNKIDQNKEDKILERSKNNINLENNEFNDSATQTDIFGIDAKETSTETSINIDTNAIQNTSIKNNTLDLLKFNENDSIIEHSSEKYINSENLEDTADAANLTELNSSANLDEIFCGKLIRTSTQSTENLHEQDTLPVTDSVFGSLPLSQDSQCTNEFNIEIPHPELLDSIQPIYPTLISCKEPITSIIEHLTNPLWVQHLSTYFINRNIQSIGDLAQLSEREINRIPVKGNSKIEFVKSVLKCFEKKYISKELNNTMENVDNVLNNEISRSVNINVLSSTLKVSQDQILKDITTNIDETHNKLNHNVTLNQPSSSRTCNVIITDKNTETTVSKSSDITSSDIIQIINIPISPKIVTTSENIIGNSIPFVRSAISSIQTTKTVGTCTSSDSIYLSKTGVNKATKSVAAQMALEDLLDEIDVNLVLESAARRCTPDKLLIQYKDKMRHVSQVELETETIKILGAENRKNCNEITLKAACRACGINKVLLRLPDIFSTDKQFFVKVLNAYKKKIKTSDCMDILDFNEVKDAVCQKCTSSEFAEMLSKKLKEEEQEGIRKPMTELSSLDAMLKRMPMDVIISHTVANDELIPSRVVLDIALQNNSPTDIIQALESQSSVVTQNVFNKLWSSQFAIEYINQCKSKEDLLKIFKAISLKLSQQDLLQAFYESMNVKLMVKQEND